MKITPTASTQRIEMLDTLRGFAIFGILMVNMPLFFNPVSSLMVGYTGSDSLLDLASQLFIKFFFEGKFYVLFSMLFGYGFWLFINRQREDGRSLIPTFRMRAFILLIFGMLHILLLWAGDILLFYAMFGFILILFRKKSDRGIVKWAIWLGLIPTIFALLFLLMYLLTFMHPDAKAGFDAGMQGNAEAMLKLMTESAVIYKTGTFAQLISVRFTEYSTLFFGGIFFFYPVVLAMFLLGTWAARKDLIRNFMDHLAFFRKAMIWGLLVGIIANGLYAYSYLQAAPGQPGVWGFLGTSMHLFGGIAFCLVYVSAIVLLSGHGKLITMRKYLAPVGRMALTNYLLHSIICTTMALPYGLGLFGKINAFQGILLTIIIFGLQIPFSHFWLKKFYFGPFEWLWRSLTYLKWQPFVRKNH